MRVRNQGKKVYKKYLENNDVEKAPAKKRGRKSLYTEAERKEIRSLQSMKYRRMKKPGKRAGIPRKSRIFAPLFEPCDGELSTKRLNLE